MLKKLTEIIKLVAWLIIAAAAASVIYWLPHIAGVPVNISAAPSNSPGFTQAEFISIILTAVTVVLGALAIMLAIAAFWGYNSIRESAQRAGEVEARKVATDVAQVIAARVAEKTVQQSAEGSSKDGDAIAAAVGRENVVGS